MVMRLVDAEPKACGAKLSGWDDLDRACGRHQLPVRHGRRRECKISSRRSFVVREGLSDEQAESAHVINDKKRTRLGTVDECADKDKKTGSVRGAAGRRLPRPRAGSFGVRMTACIDETGQKSPCPARQGRTEELSALNDPA